MDKVAYLRGVLQDARLRGDRGVERAVSADLARLGHPVVPEPAAAPTGAPAMETTTVEQPEKAVPAAKRRRRAPAPKPKDETG